MSFSDPLSVTVAGVTTPLPRVEVGKGASAYRSADGLISVSASSLVSKRARRVLRIDHSKITSDPFIPSQNATVSMSNYMVFDTPPAGYTLAQVVEVYAGFKALFTASSDALIAKLLGGES